MESLLDWFNSSTFMPHGHCYLWRPGILWLNVGSDLLIALSYFAIPTALVLFLRRRKDVPFSGIFALFAAFILLCGSTHAMAIWTVWNPDYQIEGLVKLATALVSATTATTLYFVMPKALQLRTPAQLEAVVAQRTTQLADSNAQLRVAVDEYRSAERAHQESESRLQTLFDTIPIMLAFIDGKGRYQMVNQQYLDAFELEGSEVLGQPVKTVLDPAAFEVVRPHMERAMAGEATTFQLELDLPAGRREKQVSYAPDRSMDGPVRGYFAALTDITATKAFERELEAARQAAETANRTKSEFLANVSHEVRTPLAAILGYAEVLEAQVDSDAGRRHIAVIRRNGHHLLDILNDILDLSKIEAGRMDIHPEPINPAQLVADVVSLMEVPAAEKQLPLRYHFFGKMPRRIRTDPVRLRQILVNLISNAIKYTGEGEVAIEVRLLASAEPRLSFDVVDTGVGIAPADQARLFRPFTQVDSTSTREHGGTGMGLVISRRLAGLLGGELGVESTPGQGSRFSLTLPTGSLEGVPIEEPKIEGRSSAQAAALPDVSLQGHVLVVDDRQDLQDLVRYLITQAGAQVSTLSDGQAAIDAIRRGSLAQVDLILMDMQMPQVDGYQATRVIRELGYEGPIIALTASAMAGVHERCLMAGCTDYLSKPVTADRLIRTLVRFLPSTAPAQSQHAGDDDAALPLVADAKQRQQRVLLVEDNQDAAQALEILLEANGYQVMATHCGSEALAAWQDFAPGVVLCDLSLPDLSGKDVAASIHQADPGVRLIALTGNPGDPAELKAVGFSKVLVKPISWSALRKELEEDAGR